MAASGTCACGNAATTACEQCDSSVCGLCVRKDERGAAVCIKCRSGAVKRAELRELEAQRRARGGSLSARLNVQRVRRRWVVLPATLVALLALLSAVVVPLLDAGASRAERRAHAALDEIVAAEERFHDAAKVYGTVDELYARQLLVPLDVAGYEMRVDLSADKKRYFARAIPTDARLRILCADERGRVIIESERPWEAASAPKRP